jgi:hypothetical protein
VSKYLVSRSIKCACCFRMSPHAMPMAQIMPGVPAGSAGVDPAYWPHDLSNGSLSPRTVQQSPGGYSSARDSVSQSITPTAQTPPQSDSSRKNSAVEGGQQNSQKNKLAVDASQRASVAVACVPCRSRHLKCDGGVRCSRCRADGVDCTYIKSRRGWKGKRKNKPEDQVSPVAINGVQTPHVPISNGHMVNGTIIAQLLLQWRDTDHEPAQPDTTPQRSNHASALRSRTNESQRNPENEQIRPSWS